MGLAVFVLRSAGGGSTNGGISKSVPELTLVNVEGPSDPDPEALAALLVKGDVQGTVRIVGAKHVAGLWVPEDRPDEFGPMFGGNYAATADHRFGEAIEGLVGHKFYGAVAIHDRWKTKNYTP